MPGLDENCALALVNERRLARALGRPGSDLVFEALEALTAANPLAEVHLIEGADHYFQKGLGTLGRLAGHWLERRRDL